MSETMTTHVAQPKRNGAAGAAVLVSGNALATHLGMTRQAVAWLTAQAIIERRADGRYDLDQSRLKYIAHLRSDARRSPRTQADADHVKVKTEMLQVKLMEKRRELVRRDQANTLLDTICGVVLTHLSGMAARCSRDMLVRRNIDAVVLQVRTEMAEVCTKLADEAGEPPLDAALTARGS